MEDKNICGIVLDVSDSINLVKDIEEIYQGLYNDFKETEKKLEDTEQQGFASSRRYFRRIAGMIRRAEYLAFPSDDGKGMLHVFIHGNRGYIAPGKEKTINTKKLEILIQSSSDGDALEIFDDLSEKHPLILKMQKRQLDADYLKKNFFMNVQLGFYVLENVQFSL